MQGAQDVNYAKVKRVEGKVGEEKGGGGQSGSDRIGGKDGGRENRQGGRR